MPLRHTYSHRESSLTLLCSLCSVPSVRGQERLSSTARSNFPRLRDEFENRSLRPGTDMRDAYLRNPALIHRMVGERRYFSAEKSRVRQREPGTIFIAADGASGRQEGDYLPYEGQEFRDFSVRADGYKQGDRATFFARIGFTAGGNDNVGWSALRNPGLYWPYIVADSTGGDFRYEKYDLMCGYSFRLGRFDLGMSGGIYGRFRIPPERSPYRGYLHVAYVQGRCRLCIPPPCHSPERGIHAPSPACGRQTLPDRTVRRFLHRIRVSVCFDYHFQPRFFQIPWETTAAYRRLRREI